MKLTVAQIEKNEIRIHEVLKSILLEFGICKIIDQLKMICLEEAVRLQDEAFINGDEEKEEEHKSWSAYAITLDRILSPLARGEGL